jgi:hypothetical protein
MAAMAEHLSSDMRAIVEAAQAELVGSGAIVGVAVGARPHHLVLLVNGPVSRHDRTRVDLWADNLGVTVELKDVGEIVLSV